MVDIDEQLKSLNNKIQLLLKQNQHLQKENAALKTELEKKEVLLNRKIDLIKNMEQKIDALHLRASSMDEEERKQFEKRIDMYLSEIEKCLTLLNA